MVLAITALIACTLATVPEAAAITSTNITVDRTDDTAAASACTGSAADCSLRGAISFANAHPGTTITLPPGTYLLTIAGSAGGENDGLCGNPAVGDLDVTASGTTLTGDGPATTIIRQTTVDRVICLNPALVSNFVFTLSGVTVTGGRETHSIGGGGMVSGARNNITRVSDCVFSNNQTTGPSPGGGALQNFGGDLYVSDCTFGGTDLPGPDQSVITQANQTDVSGGAISYTAGDPLGVGGATGTLSVTNTTFLNNIANSAAAGGGGLDVWESNTSTSTRAVSDSTFIGNRAPNASGGAIVIESGPLDIVRSLFRGNRAHGAGGALYSSGFFTASQDAFEGNSVDSTTGGGGGAIGMAAYDLTGTVHYSRFSGNTAAVPANGNTIFRAPGSGPPPTSTLDIDANWWGQNTGPAAFDAAGATATTWLQLRHAPSVSTVPLGGAAGLSADILGANNGGPVAAGNLIGLPAFPSSGTVFGNASRGSLSAASTQFVNGLASATFTAGTTSAACGLGGADATADGQTLTAAITVRCPDLTVTKSDGQTTPPVVGEAWAWSLLVTNGGDADATFSAGDAVVVDHLPDAATISYGIPTADLGGVDCSIDGSDDLTCTASGPLTLIPSAAFTVSFAATAGAPGDYQNPRATTTCSVDPDDHAVESAETNNGCADTVTVTKADTTSAITADNPDSSYEGETVTVAYTVTVDAPGAGTATGDVTVSDGIDECTATVAAGQCDVTLTTPGSRTLTAVYLGDGNFETSTSAGEPHTVVAVAPPSITSADNTTFTAETAESFTVTTDPGSPPATTISLGGDALPSGLSFSDNGDGTATLDGTADLGTGGTYNLTFTPANAFTTGMTQDFVLTVNEPRPTVTAISPPRGLVTGGTAITITGTGFLPGAVVEIGQGEGPGGSAILATDVVVVSDTEITATTGGGAVAGTYHLFVITAGGASLVERANRFHYIDVRPTVTSVTPARGPASGGTPITITGTGFVPGATVLVAQDQGPGPSAIAATDVVVVSSTEITAITGGGAAPGLWHLFVVTGAGASRATAADRFRYQSSSGGGRSAATQKPSWGPWPRPFLA